MSGLDLINSGVLWFFLSGHVVRRSGLRNGKLVRLLSDKFNNCCNNSCNGNNCSCIPLDEFNFHACHFLSYSIFFSIISINSWLFLSSRPMLLSK